MSAFQNIIHHHGLCGLWATASLLTIMAAVFAVAYMVCARKSPERPVYVPETLHVFALIIAGAGEAIEAFLQF